MGGEFPTAGIELTRFWSYKTWPARPLGTEVPDCHDAYNTLTDREARFLTIAGADALLVLETQEDGVPATAFFEAGSHALHVCDESVEVQPCANHT